MDQLFLDRLAVDALDDLGRFFQAGGGDAVEHLVGILVSGEDALEVEHREARRAAPSRWRTRGSTTPSMAAAMIGMLESTAAELPGDVHLVGVDGDGARNQRDIVEPVRARAFRPRPTHMPMRSPTLLGPAPLAAADPVCREPPARPTVVRGESIRSARRRVSTAAPARASGCARSQSIRSPSSLQSGFTTCEALAHLAHLRRPGRRSPTTFDVAVHLARASARRARRRARRSRRPCPTGCWSTVLRPMASLGRTSSTRKRRAARETSASAAVSIPGAIAPPMNSPRGVHAVEVGRGAEVHDDQRRPVERDGGHALHDPVRARPHAGRRR